MLDRNQEEDGHRNNVDWDRNSPASSSSAFAYVEHTGTPEPRNRNPNSNNNNNNNNNTTQDPVREGSAREVGGAAAMGGMAGLLVFGPLGGLLGAGGGAVAATTHGKTGATTRAVGDVVASAGERLQRFSRQHRVPEQSSKGMSSMSKSVQSFEDTHHVKERAAKTLVAAGKSWKSFDQKHSVTEKTSTGIIKSCQWMTKKLKSPKNSNTTAAATATAPTIEVHATRL